MNIQIGDKVKYTFPNPVSMHKRSVVGLIESIQETFIVMITDDKVRLKVNFKNFENLELLKESETIAE